MDRYPVCPYADAMLRETLSDDAYGEVCEYRRVNTLPHLMTAYLEKFNRVLHDVPALSIKKFIKV